MKFTFLEFFAGGGMARCGLGEHWTCLFANDYDSKKLATYQANWGGDGVHAGNIADVTDLPVRETADLAWASFPCQDLSLAGNGAGLSGDRSGTFWPFWRVIKNLTETGRGPRAIVLENVCGTLASRAGADFIAICQAFSETGYRVGAVIGDARHFVPQSRPRLFIIGVRKNLLIPLASQTSKPVLPWHPQALLTAHAKLPNDVLKSWVWWQMPQPRGRSTTLTDIVEPNPKDVAWNTEGQTAALLRMMSEMHRAKVVEAGRIGTPAIGAVYKRTRQIEGQKIQRAEVRFDNIAGCLRTPAGGSSRQTIISVTGVEVRTRLISSREMARLMGLPDTYILPANYNEAYHLLGDGVVAPVVRFLASNVLEPILGGHRLDAAA